MIINESRESKIINSINENTNDLNESTNLNEGYAKLKISPDINKLVSKAIKKIS